MTFNRFFGNGWSDLDDSFGKPHEILIPCAYNSHCAQSRHWLILVYFCPDVLPFFLTQILSSISNARGTFPPSSPPKTAKNETWVAKIIFLDIFVKGQLNLWAKYSEPENQIAKKKFPLRSTRVWSSNLCATKFPHYDLILLAAFHKFAMSMGAKHQWH